MIPIAIKEVVINEYRALALLDAIMPTATNQVQLEQIWREIKTIRLGAVTIFHKC